MDENKAGENRPSEVFIALWYFRAIREPLSAENFKLCADTWWKLRAMEAAELAGDRLLQPGRIAPSRGPGRTAEGGRPPRAAALISFSEALTRAAETAESGPSRTPEDGGPAEAAAPAEQEPDEYADAEEAARKAAEAAKARSDAGQKGLVTRKKNVLDALEELRSRGVSLQTIADADRRLTLLDVLQMMEHKPVSLPVLAALERAVGVLRARAGGPTEEDMT